MRAKTIRRLRVEISMPEYYKTRLNYFTYEANWYEVEFNIRHRTSDLIISQKYKRKIPWYQKKVDLK